jgi:hypothetical protein
LFDGARAVVNGLWSPRGEACGGLARHGNARPCVAAARGGAWPSVAACGGGRPAMAGGSVWRSPTVGGGGALRNPFIRGWWRQRSEEADDSPWRTAVLARGGLTEISIGLERGGKGHREL